MSNALIVGGGVAGSSLALMVGRKGLAVRVFEKARFPRKKPCGEGLMPEGVAVLQRLGLTAAVGGCPFYGVRFYSHTQAREVGAPEVVRFRSAGLGQRRGVLDQVLLSAAAATSSVQVHTGTRVDGRKAQDLPRIRDVLHVNDWKVGEIPAKRARRSFAPPVIHDFEAILRTGE